MVGNKRRKTDHNFLCENESISSIMDESLESQEGTGDHLPAYDEDCLPFQTVDQVLLAKKQIAMIKNKQAAQKYREKKKNTQDILLTRLNQMEAQMNTLQIENAGLKAEN